MAYLKPPWFVSKVFNKLATLSSVGGTRKLTVPGRSSGKPRAVPVIPVEVAGAHYLVSTRGESEWVRNVRAAGEVRLGREKLKAVELATEARIPIIEAYRAKAGKTVDTYWRSLPDPADHPVFKLG